MYRDAKNSNKETMISQALVILHSFCTHVFTVLGVLRDQLSADLVVLRRRTVVQPHSKRDSCWRLLLKRFPHQSRDALPPCPFILGRAGVICMHSATVKTIQLLVFFLTNAKKGVVCFSYLCACSSSPAPVWVSVDL